MKTLDDVIDFFYEERQFGLHPNQIDAGYCDEILGELEKSLNDFYNGNIDWKEVDNNDFFQDIIFSLTHSASLEGQALVSLFTYERDLLACQFLVKRHLHTNYLLPEIKATNILMT